jgi:hypothetical protein
MTEPTIFDYIKDVLFTKKGTFTSTHVESLNFQPFMLQRWCSMASKDSTLILNETTNRWSLFFNDKDLIYKIMFTCLPKQKQKKVAYIKKSSNLSTEEDNNVSNALEISKREAKEYNEIITYLHHDKLDTVS